MILVFKESHSISFLLEVNQVQYGLGSSTHLCRVWDGWSCIANSTNVSLPAYMQFKMSESDEYRCFIGGLAWSTSDRKLKDTFEKFGKLTEAKVIDIIINSFRCWFVLYFLLRSKHWTFILWTFLFYDENCNIYWTCLLTNQVNKTKWSQCNMKLFLMNYVWFGE